MSQPLQKYTNAHIRKELGERGFLEERDYEGKVREGLISSWKRGIEEVILFEFNDGREPRLFNAVGQSIRNIRELKYRNQNMMENPDA